MSVTWNPCSRVFLSHHWPCSTSCNQAHVRLCDHLSVWVPCTACGQSWRLPAPHLALSWGGVVVHVPEEFQPQAEVAAP